VAAGPVSAEVAALTEGVLRGMFVSRLKTLVAVMVLVLFAGAAGGLGLRSVGQGQPGTGGLRGRAAPVSPGAPGAAAPAGKKAKALPQGKVEPAGAPLAAVLKAKKVTYKLDLGGRSAEDFRKLAKASNTFEEDGPLPPEVDLVFEVRNTSKKDIKIFTLPDLAEVVLELKGPDALTVEMQGPFTADRRLPRPITLAPGKAFTRPIGRLEHGQRDIGLRSYWLAPGDYTLTARFVTGVSPRPKGAQLWEDPVAEVSGFGGVTVTTPPLRLKVTR
jgi:hypothetical protein